MAKEVRTTVGISNPSPNAFQTSRVTSAEEFLDAADGVRIASSELSWQDWERWSQRPRTSMKLGGIVGRLVLEGVGLQSFALLLAAAEALHAGKGATFGLGRVRVRPHE